MEDGRYGFLFSYWDRRSVDDRGGSHSTHLMVTSNPQIAEAVKSDPTLLEAVFMKAFGDALNDQSLENEQIYPKLSS